MEKAKSQETKADRASDAIDAFRKAKNVKNADETSAALRKLADGEPPLQVILTSTVRTILEDEEAGGFTIALLERQLELNPDDYDARFQLAFKQSEAGNEAIALHHYYKIPHGERSGITWNNIGAASDQLGLPTKAVDAFIRASGMDETLPLANLGFKLLNIGFQELAREQCSKALKHPKPHPNVGNLVTALASVEENEKAHQKSVLDGVETQVSLLQRLGRAATRATPDTIAAEWQGPDCGFKCVQRGNKIVLTGKYEREDGLLAALVAPPLGLGKAGMPTPKSKFLISYSGQIRGLAVIGEYKHEREGASLLGSAGEKKVFMILSEDGTEMTVFEGADTKEPTIHVLKSTRLLNAS
jgi:tetratricopeptide (TPR) repeat protein